jgi:hypothetical protein
MLLVKVPMAVARIFRTAVLFMVSQLVLLLRVLYGSNMPAQGRS